MKILHGFLGFIFWLVVLAAGLWMVAGRFGFDCAVADAILGDPRQRPIIGAALILLVVIYWISAVPRSKEERAVSYEHEGGRVSVSIKAVNALLSRLEDEFAAIENLRASVNPRDKSVRLDMAVKSGAKIQELSQALQQRVSESLQDNLGISDVGAIRVFVREIMPPENASTKDREDHGEWQNIPI